MSSTLMSKMKAYKSKEPQRGNTIYALIVNSAESNITPLHYEDWTLTCDEKWKVMGKICQMAGDLYSGGLKWPGAIWGDEKICSKFLQYAENVMKDAKTTEDPVPEITSHFIIDWDPDDPCADIWRRFIPLGYCIKKLWSREVLVKYNPTVLDLYNGFSIRQHYESCLRYARGEGELDIAKLRKNLFTNGYMLPMEIRLAFNTNDSK